jgi:hypothetical protein
MPGTKPGACRQDVAVLMAGVAGEAKPEAVKYILDRPRHYHPGKPRMFRVSRNDLIADSETIYIARKIVRGEKPGRYHVDEIRTDPLPSGHTPRAWSKLIRHADGRVEDEPHPWGE